MSPSPRRRDSAPRRRELTVEEYLEGIRGGDRAVLARAITLVESGRGEHQEKAQELLTAVLPHTGRSLRVGITGVPGVGKSSFIETLGMRLIGRDHRVAVLAIDPSSGRSGGSILGDKTRMARLAAEERAFIRPSPSAGTLGGVAQKSRETLLLCEAAGYDTILVETMGVGQSETVVAGMTDVFLALLLAGAGDELQGIKRGLLELVDVLAVNKADGDNRQRAESAARDVATALHIVHGHDDREVPVLTCSATEDDGVDEVWAAVESLVEKRRARGEIERVRREQMLNWMHSLLDERLWQAFRQSPAVVQRIGSLETDVREGRVPPFLAVKELLDAFLGSKDGA